MFVFPSSPRPDIPTVIGYLCIDFPLDISRLFSLKPNPLYGSAFLILLSSHLKSYLLLVPCLTGCFCVILLFTIFSITLPFRSPPFPTVAVAVMSVISPIHSLSLQTPFYSPRRNFQFLYEGIGILLKSGPQMSF